MKCVIYARYSSDGQPSSFFFKRDGVIFHSVIKRGMQTHL